MNMLERGGRFDMKQQPYHSLIRPFGSSAWEPMFCNVCLGNFRRKIVKPQRCATCTRAACLECLHGGMYCCVCAGPENCAHCRQCHEIMNSSAMLHSCASCCRLVCLKPHEPRDPCGVQCMTCDIVCCSTCLKAMGSLGGGSQMMMDTRAVLKKRHSPSAALLFVNLFAPSNYQEVLKEEKKEKESKYKFYRLMCSKCDGDVAAACWQHLPVVLGSGRGSFSSTPWTCKPCGDLICSECSVLCEVCGSTTGICDKDARSHNMDCLTRAGDLLQSWLLPVLVVIVKNYLSPYSDPKHDPPLKEEERRRKENKEK